MAPTAPTLVTDQPYRRQRIRPLEPLWVAARKLGAAWSLALGAGRVLLQDQRERRAGPAARLYHAAPGVAAGGGASLALYAHYSAHGGISEMVLHQLRDYVRLGFRVVFVSSAESLDAASWQAVCGIAELVLHRRNHGFDFGAWSDALAVATQAAEPLAELLLVNDSVLGPLHPLDQPLASLRAAGDGLFGLTDSVQHAPHLQSYFLLARGSGAIADVLAFLRRVPLSASKHRMVRRGEIALSCFARARGHRVAALWGYAALENAMVASEEARAGLLAALPSLAQHPPPGVAALRRALLDLPLNPVHHFAALLVHQAGFPFLKTELVLRNPVRLPEAADWPALVPAASPTPLALLADHLAGLRPRPAATPAPAALTPAEPALPLRVLDAAWARARQAEPPAAPAVALVSAAALRAALAGPVVVAFSHDDYAVNCGGVQNVLAAEERAFAAAGIGYLHLAPLVSRHALADPAEVTLLRLRSNGTALGAVPVATLRAALAEAGVQGQVRAVVVHHLAGHAPEQVLALLRAARAGQPLFWLHDYASLCVSPPMLRNDLVFCGAPPEGSAACGICAHGPARGRHLARMRSFLGAARPQLLAPSPLALAFWQRHGGDAGLPAAVLPPARLAAAALPLPPRAPGRRLRVAHLGTRDYHKGWQVFADLAERCAADPRYLFLQLGLDHGPPLPPGLRCVPVQPGAASTMAEAVAAHEVDIVVNWSLCHETFSFTVHEAMAGGAFVLVRAAGGNLWPAVQAHAPERGLALDTAAELLALFAGDRLPALLAARPPVRRQLQLGGGSAEWLLGQAAPLEARHG